MKYFKKPKLIKFTKSILIGITIILAFTLFQLLFVVTLGSFDVDEAVEDFVAFLDKYDT